MSQQAVKLTRVVAALTAIVVVGGCASSAGKRAARAQLDRAHAAYQVAESDPNVQSYAALRLMDAQKTLQAAQEAKDTDEKMHLAYLAERKAQLATMLGATGNTEQNMQNLRRETAEVLLQKRDRELSEARRETEMKTREADQARRAAEARAREGETRARALEQARRPTDDSKGSAADQARSGALANELASLKAQQTDRGIVLTIGDVLFAPGKVELGTGAQRSIDKLAEFLKTYPRRNVLIEGHTDNIGNEEFNIKLSQQRADAVRDLLAAKGVAPQRIRTKGFGPKFPVVDNDTSAGRQQNRRVEVIVLDEGATADGSTR